MADASLSIVINAVNGAQKDLEEVKRQLDALGKAGVSTGDSLGKAGESALKFETTERRVESVTRALGFQMVSMATSGAGVKNGFDAAAMAAGFLGNAFGSLAGPIGVVVAITGSVVEGIFKYIANAKEAAKVTDLEKQEMDQLNQSMQASLDLKSALEPLMRSELEFRLRMQDVGASERERVAIALEQQKKELEMSAAETIANPEKLRSASLRNLYLKDYAEKLAAVVAKLHELEIAEKRAGIVAVQGAEMNQQAWEGSGKALKIWSLEEQQAFEKAVALRAEMERFNALMKNGAVVAQQTGAVIGAVYSYLDATGRASFEEMQAVKMAEAVVNTAAAIMVAMGSPGTIYSNIALAASAAAIGALQIATIAQASPGSSTAPSAPSLSGGSMGGNTSAVNPFSGTTGSTSNTFGTGPRTGSSFQGGGSTMYVYINYASDQAIEEMFRRAGQLGMIALVSGRANRIAGASR